MNYPTSVKIVEVGPRDGLQNEKVLIDVTTKLALINQLANAGIDYIEAGSFVSPKWVPQMAGSDEVFTKLPKGTTTYAALTPNMQGLQRAMACDVKKSLYSQPPQRVLVKRISIALLMTASNALPQLYQRLLNLVSQYVVIFPVYWVAPTKARLRQTKSLS